MKALTIWQPWASLLALQMKRYETRSWSTDYRGQLAIHAAKGFQKSQRAMFECWPVYDYFKQNGIEYPGQLPLGAVIAVCDLVECIRITHAFVATQPKAERQLGDFTLGRYAWRLTNVTRIEPVYVRGQQGLWNCPDISRYFV